MIAFTAVSHQVSRPSSVTPEPARLPPQATGSTTGKESVGPSRLGALATDISRVCVLCLAGG